jgi:hypothetical protein
MKDERRWRVGSVESISPKNILLKDTTAVKKTYGIGNREEKSTAGTIEQFAKLDGEVLLPLIELITQRGVPSTRRFERIERPPAN